MLHRLSSPLPAAVLWMWLAVLAAILSVSPSFAQIGAKRAGPAVTPKDANRASSPASRGSSVAHLAIGERVPDFTLEDGNGVGHKLSAMRGGWVALVFAGRRESIASLDSLASLLAAEKIHLVAVWVEKAQTIRRYRGTDQSPLLALADPTAEVTALYGLWEEVTRTPIPGWVLISPEGIARVALLGLGLPNDEAHQLMRYIATAEP